MLSILPASGPETSAQQGALSLQLVSLWPTEAGIDMLAQPSLDSTSFSLRLPPSPV